MPTRPFRTAARLVGRTMRRQRETLGRSQEFIAERMRVTVRNYQKMEAGDLNLTLGTLSAISRVLKIPLAELFGE